MYEGEGGGRGRVRLTIDNCKFVNLSLLSARLELDWLIRSIIHGIFLIQVAAT